MTLLASSMDAFLRDIGWGAANSEAANGEPTSQYAQ